MIVLAAIVKMDFIMIEAFIAQITAIAANAVDIIDAVIESTVMLTVEAF